MHEAGTLRAAVRTACGAAPLAVRKERIHALTSLFGGTRDNGAGSLPSEVLNGCQKRSIHDPGIGNKWPLFSLSTREMAGTLESPSRAARRQS
jgi:hypothetical protein